MAELGPKLYLANGRREDSGEEEILVSAPYDDGQDGTAIDVVDDARRTVAQVVYPDAASAERGRRKLIEALAEAVSIGTIPPVEDERVPVRSLNQADG